MPTARWSARRRAAQPGLSTAGNALATLDSSGSIHLDHHRRRRPRPDQLLRRTNGDLKVAHCENADCAGGDATPPSTARDVGQYTSITIGADG